MTKNSKTLLSVFVAVAAMVGLAFASVPLYTLFCQGTGFGGTTQTASAAPDEILDRTVRVLFNADVSPGLNWEFKPEQHEVVTQLGKQTLVSYRAKNISNKTLTGTALYNVAPPKTGQYFHKIECFCFAEQSLAPGEEIIMPVVFYIDPELDRDRGMEDVKTITLSYTFFESNTKTLDEAMEDFYNAPVN